MILALEGLDGCGKTSVGRRVADRLGVPLVTGLGCVAISQMEGVMRDYESSARYLLYMTRTMLIGQTYATSGQTVVVDRYAASCHALHVGSNPRFQHLMQQVAFPAAFMTVHLTVDEGVRLSRLKNRGLNEDPFEARLRMDDEFRAASLRVYEGMTDAYRISSDLLSEVSIANLIVERWLLAQLEESS